MRKFLVGVYCEVEFEGSSRLSSDPNKNPLD